MAHGHTILAQVLKMTPRSHIESLDKEHGTGRQSRVLSRWSQFGALLFAQLAGRHSLRDVVHCMAAQAGALAPLGLTPPKRSTLAEANNRRPATLYHTLFLTLYARCQAVAPGHGFRFKNPLFSLDSTTLSLCLSLSPWARSARPMELLNSTPSWTTPVTYPPLASLLRASAAISPLPVGYRSPRAAS
jgi:hypothetical protein